MTWMNKWDVEDALHFYVVRSDVFPNARKASIVLARLMDWTDENSDGWAYWNKPSNAAKRLQEYLSGWRKRYVDGDDTDLTDAELTAMLKPVKAFYTRQHVDVDWSEFS